MSARGPTCPTCHGCGDVCPSGVPYNVVTCGDCCGLGYIETAGRTLTRAVYDNRREDAHCAERDANLLRYADPSRAKKLDREAELIRAEISAPPDHEEARRNARWFKLRAALLSARGACAQLRAARSLARAA